VQGLMTGSGDMVLTIAAVCSWCLFAYMVPVVWFIVWRRRRADPTQIIQGYDVEDFVDDEL
jgi:hypothetical protein